MDPLSQLRDLHIPQAPGYWPPAPGWWLLMALGLVLVVAGFYLLLKSRRKNAYRRAGLAAMGELDLSSDTFILDALRLVRQTALSGDETSGLAVLPGPELVAVIDQFSGGDFCRILELDRAAGNAELNNWLYSERCATLSREQKRSLLAQIQAWIKKHPRESLC